MRSRAGGEISAPTSFLYWSPQLLVLDQCGDVATPSERKRFTTSRNLLSSKEQTGPNPGADPHTFDFCLLMMIT